MKEEFALRLKAPNEYDFINGRIRVLETYLFPLEELKRISVLPYDEIIRELEVSSYGKYIKSTEINSVANGLLSRYDEEIKELSQYVSPGFINVFAKSKELFLKLKRWGVSGQVNVKTEEQLLFNFVHDGKGDFPLILRNYFVSIQNYKENPFIVSAITDIFHLKYLIQFAKMTKSNFIIDYSEKYVEIYSLVLITRASELLKANAIAEKDFKLIIPMLVNEFGAYKFVSKFKSIKTYDDFLIFSKAEKELYGAIDQENLENVVREKLFALIEKGRFVLEGIEPVFVYIERLDFELEFLMNAVYSAYGKTKEVH